MDTADMKWLRFRLKDGPPRIGLSDNGQVFDLSSTCDRVRLKSPVIDAIAAASFPALLAASSNPESEVSELVGLASIMDRDDLELLAPIPDPPKNVVCIGRNFREHAVESARYREQAVHLPEYPIFFSKPRSTITDPDSAIEWDPTLSNQLDYEGEIAVIIGRRGVDIPAEAALDHVWGVTLVNDLSFRDIQGRHTQWLKGKAIDGTLPMGPAVVPLSYIEDLSQLSLETRVNGQLRQSAVLGDLIFDIAELIVSWSRGTTIEPGEVIATGTPSGVGLGFDPPRFLKDGDLVEVSSKEIGILRNTFRHRFEQPQLENT